MQLHGINSLEQRTRDALAYVETVLPASTEATVLSSTIADAGNELQILRRMVYALASPVSEIACQPMKQVIATVRARAQNDLDKAMPPI